MLLPSVADFFFSCDFDNFFFFLRIETHYRTDNMVINYLNGDIMSTSLTLPGSGFHLGRRKHSLHDVLDWDRPEPLPQSDALQRIVDIVKKTGIVI